MRDIRRRIDAMRERKSLYLFLAAAGVALFVTILAPVYIASQPAYFKRYPVTEKYWSSWSKSTHAEIACSRCHVPPDILSQARHRLRMLEEFYLSALMPGRSPDILEPPPNDACRKCHATNRTASPSGDLRIPHKAHVIVLKMKCITCHNWVVHFRNPEGTHAPRMATCLKCHNGKRAKNGCSDCHKKKTFPVGHRAANWLVIHPKQQAKVNCKGCHGWVRNWCRECHTKRPASHVTRWRSLHGDKVAVRRNCEACHVSSFCIKCHGEVPRLNRRMAPKFVR